MTVKSEDKNMGEQKEELLQRRKGGFTSGFKSYPAIRKMWLWDKSVEPWIKNKRTTDGAEGLWRVHDNLYNLESFAAQHPGGSFWIETSRGHDITELFEASHPLNTGIPEKLLEKYFVRKASRPRNAPYTFHEDGFYRTLKRRVAPTLRKVGTGPTLATKLISDSCFCMFVGSSLATAVVKSQALAAISAVALSLAIGTGHNFFHQRDNFRMFYLDLSFLSSAEWRVSHAMSHHMFPNTAVDLEVIQLEPITEYLTIKKGWWSRGVFPFLIHQLTLPTGFVLEGVKRTVRWIRGEQKPTKANFIPILHLLAMTGTRFIYTNFANSNSFTASIPESLGTCFRQVLPFWLGTHMLASYVFLSIGLAAAHHHPDIFHDGDVTLTSQDWGLHQLNAVGDRIAIRGNLPLTLTTFGDHGLHHLFPTVDHAKLGYVYPLFEQVCADFGVRYRYFSVWELVRGGYQQMARTEPRRSNLMDVEVKESG